MKFDTHDIVKARDALCEVFGVTKYKLYIDTPSYSDNTCEFVYVHFRRINDPRLRSKFIRFIESKKDAAGMQPEDIAIAAVPPLRGNKHGVLYDFRFLVSSKVLVTLG